MIGVFLLAAMTVAPRAFSAECAFGVPPTMIERSDALLQYWDLPTDDLLNIAAAPESEEFAAYRRIVESKLPTTPGELLERYLTRGKNPADVHNLETVLHSRLGAIRPMNCVEGLLLAEQMRRNPRFADEPTEFLAIWLRKDERLRIYFLTGDSGGIRGAAFSALLDRVAADRKEGWCVLINLHNHSFFLGRLDSDAPQGVLAPSGNDVRTFRSQVESLDLKAASITNGFDTLVIPAGDLYLYQSN